MVARLQTAAAQPPKQTTDFHYNKRYPNSAARAIQVYVKRVKTPLGPLKAGPFPILRWEGKSVLVLDVGRTPDGKIREEVQHWANCQPAVLAENAQSASRVKRGRKPRSPQRPKPGPPASPSPTSTSTSSTPATATPTTKPHTATRSGRQVRSTKRSEYIY